MIRRVVLLALAISLWTAAAARAEVVAPPEVLALVDHMKVAVVEDQTIRVEPCPDAKMAETSAGCTYRTPDAVVYITPGFETHWFTIYHELGHRFDYIAMTGLDRLKFTGLVGSHSRRWSDSLSQRFADAYAYCARNPVRLVDDDTVPPGHTYSNRTHRKICDLTDDIGVRAGLV